MAEKMSCRNCGSHVSGRWCSHCGQKQLTEQDRKLPALLAHAAEQLFSLNGKLIITLRTLLSQPGQLDTAWIAGKRMIFLPPIALFVLINLIFFLFPPFTDFQLDLHNQLYQPYGALIEPMVQARLDTLGISLDEYNKVFSVQASRIAETLIFIHLPFLGLVLMWLHWNRSVFYAEHVVVGMHLFSAFMLIALLMSLVFFTIAAGLTLAGIEFPNLSAIAIRVFNLVMLLYCFFALRRTYQLSIWRAALSTLALILGLVIIHLFVYRPVQFLVVFSNTG